MTDWPTRALGDVLDVFDSKRVPLSSAERATRQGPFPYYGAQGIIDYIDDFIFDGRFILIPEDGENLRSRKLPVAYFAEGRFWVNNHAHIVKAKDGVAVDRFVQSAIEAADISPYITGAAQPKLSQANLLQVEIPFPEFHIQRRVATVLDALDDLIDNNRRRIELLEQMAQAIYREWFVHYRYPGHKEAAFVDSPVGLVPMGWELTTASEALEVNPRVKIDKTLEHPFLAMGDLSESGMVCFPSANKVGNSGAKFQNGDTLFARITPCLENGKTGLVQCLADGQTGRGSTEFVVLRGREVGPAFTYCLARSQEFRDHAIQSMSGASGRQRVRNECFESYVFPLAPSSLVAEFEALADPALRMVHALARESLRLSAIRDLLLPKLVTGQLDVSELDLDAVAESVA